MVNLTDFKESHHSFTNNQFVHLKDGQALPFLCDYFPFQQKVTLLKLEFIKNTLFIRH